MEFQKLDEDRTIEEHKQCLIWAPIPLLTWVCPVLGHTAISTSSGEINDFAGNYTIHHSMNKTCFGYPTKIIPIHANSVAFDEAIATANAEFQQTKHNLLTNNCHHHVARVLEIASIDPKTFSESQPSRRGALPWSSRQQSVLALITKFATAKCIDKDAALRTFLPTVMLYGCIALCIVAVKFLF